MKVAPAIQDFCNFLDESPTSWHAVASISHRLREAGFTELDEKSPWKLKRGGKYFTIRNGSLCAFILPKKDLESSHIVAAHTDSPALKLKPNAEYRKENMILLGVEVYGGPLLTSWVNRDLAIAGRVFYHDSKGIQEALVYLDQYPVIIPQLAIHLDREVNEKGLLLNKQEHLNAVATLSSSLKEDQSYLHEIISSEIKNKEILSTELFLTPLEPARLFGLNRELLASYRLDNLGSVHAATTGIIESSSNSDTLSMAIFWDHEEVGSNSMQGAHSPFLGQILERISLFFEQGREEYFCFLQNSICVSVDLTHALNPNYSEKHDPRHKPLLGQGVVVKSNAQQRYASESELTAFLTWLCAHEKLPLQKFVNRSDMLAGTTVGPITATTLGIPTIDIGYPQLSMHSIREVVACQDHLDMCQLMAAILK